MGRDPGVRGCCWRTRCFNPRARVGRDHKRARRHGQRHEFQSTRPRGARLIALHEATIEDMFQSTRPRGARLYSLIHLIDLVRFQSTRPRGARRQKERFESVTGVFQSTRPRGARHRDIPVAVAVAQVSIHAPAWGATKQLRIPHWRMPSFNPRARVGRDSRDVRLVALSPVSIHAPAWGATPLEFSEVIGVVFQSTRPRGARLSPNWTNTNYSTKQSYIQVATKLTKITRPAVPQFRCQGTRANIVINQHHLPFAQHRARQLAKPQGHKVSSHQNAPPFFANSSRGYIRAGYLLTHQ